MISMLNQSVSRPRLHSWRCCADFWCSNYTDFNTTVQAYTLVYRLRFSVPVVYTIQFRLHSFIFKTSVDRHYTVVSVVPGTLNTCTQTLSSYYVGAKETQ